MALSLLPFALLVLCGAAVAAPASATAAAQHWLMPALCHVAGLALTLALAARLTPAAWWHRPTARGALILAGGTWACGGALALAAGLGAPLAAPALPAMHAASGKPAAMTMPAPPQTSQRTSQQASPPFRVHRSVNLRTGASVGAARLAVIPAGARLTPTGGRVGDWWQVQVDSDGKLLTGWVSSLWLRRQAEQENPR